MTTRAVRHRLVSLFVLLGLVASILAPSPGLAAMPGVDNIPNAFRIESESVISLFSVEALSETALPGEGVEGAFRLTNSLGSLYMSYEIERISADGAGLFMPNGSVDTFWHDQGVLPPGQPILYQAKLSSTEQSMQSIAIEGTVDVPSIVVTLLVEAVARTPIGTAHSTSEVAQIVASLVHEFGPAMVDLNNAVEALRSEGVDLGLPGRITDVAAALHGFFGGDAGTAFLEETVRRLGGAVDAKDAVRQLARYVLIYELVSAIVDELVVFGFSAIKEEDSTSRVVIKAATAGPDPQPPVEPRLREPIGNTNSLRPLFRWNAVPGAASYELEISSKADFSVSTLHTIVVGTSFTPEIDLEANTLYYWRLAALSVSGNRSAYSSASFLVVPLRPVAAAVELMVSIEDFETDRIVWSDDGLALLAFDSASGRWTEIDPATGRTVGNLELSTGNQPGSAAADRTTLLSPNRRWAVRNLGTARSVIASLVDGAETAIGSSRMAAWSPDGSRVAVVDDQGLTRIWDAAAGEPVVEMESIVPYALNSQGMAHAGAYSLDWSPDGEFLLYTEFRGSLLCIWQADSGIIDRCVELETNVSPKAAWVADSRHVAILFDVGAPAVYSLESDSFQRLGEREFATVGGLSPDRRLLAVGTDPSRAVAGPIIIFDVLSGEVRYSLDGSYANPVWSPDGRKLLVEVREGSAITGRRVWWLDGGAGSDGAAPSAPVSVPESDSPTSDSGVLAFSDRHSLYTISSDGSRRQTVVEHNADEWLDSFTWSPGGTHIAYALLDSLSGKSNLYVFEIATGKKTFISPIDVSSPVAWHDTRIAFLRSIVYTYPESKYRLTYIDLRDGYTRYHDVSGEVTYPRTEVGGTTTLEWSTDGEWLALYDHFSPHAAYHVSGDYPPRTFEGHPTWVVGKPAVTYIDCSPFEVAPICPNATIWQHDVVTDRRIRIATLTPGEGYFSPQARIRAAVAPSGDVLAFSYPSLNVMGMDGANSAQVTEELVMEVGWSPSGDQLAYIAAVLSPFGSRYQSAGISIFDRSDGSRRDIVQEEVAGIQWQPAPDPVSAELTELIASYQPGEDSPGGEGVESGQNSGASESSQSTTSAEILIPAGSFQMGCPLNDPACEADELPLHEVYLDAYSIDKYEVTNARYAACVDEGVCTPPQRVSSYSRDLYYGNPEFDDYPVINVDWNQAVAFCAWDGGRLPTEAEWEKAARGSSDARSYPWGDEAPSAQLLNFGSLVGDTSRAGSYPGGASVYGVMDMAGNVLEETQDWYLEGYYRQSPAVNPTGPTSGEFHVLRGGAWCNGASSVRVANRSITCNLHWTNFVGFRCVRDLPAAQEPEDQGDSVAPPSSAPSGPRAADTANLRSGPGVEYEKVGQVEQGSELDIVGRNQTGDWCRLADGSWIAASLVENVPNNLPVVAAPALPAEPAVPSPPIQAAPCAVPTTASLMAGYDAALGCPTGPAFITWASYTPFEGGFTLWRQDTTRISGLFSSGTWLTVADQWDGSSATPSRGVPPPGLQEPIRGAGYIWGTNDTFFNQLGWATGQQTGFCAEIQLFEHGTILRSSTAVKCHDVHTNPVQDSDFLFFTLFENGSWVVH